ncbi:MAG: hypothetical protein M0Q13_07205 [Methanothrix sp.]|nr:hypothetical protein [Methanothrix sp.]
MAGPGWLIAGPGHHGSGLSAARFPGAPWRLAGIAARSWAGGTPAPHRRRV